MLADWLGSDRERFFPFSIDDLDRMPFARAQAQLAIDAVGLDVKAGRQTLGRERPSFAQISSFAPREAQVEIGRLACEESGTLTILESETGSGKTESSLLHFVRLFHAGQVDGMTFALPTRTAATQLHRRITAAMARAFPEESTRPATILAVPGYLQVDDHVGRRLPGFEVLWNDDATARVRHRGWAAEQPKRYLAGTVVVGTIDQVLLSSLRVSHAHLRATALLRHLLVVDEVHASDAYMTRILEEVLRNHLQAGGHAFLMSATLGTSVRERLTGASRGRSGTGPAPPTPLELARKLPYPAVHSTRRDESATTIEVRHQGPNKSIKVVLEPLAAAPEAIAQLAIEAARSGARVIVLRNTVSDAVTTQRSIEAQATEADEPLLFRIGSVRTLHHARFAKGDRAELDAAIEAAFGKNAPASSGVVAVATQTIQQSLDLDADLLITDLAPMDVLLQRFGRLHRHRERDARRPGAFREPRAVVLVGEAPLAEHLRARGSASGPHGIGTVYSDVLILEATRRLLELRPRLDIPDDNRLLVEETTHPDALGSLADALGPIWHAHRSAVWGVGRAHENIAALNLVDRSVPFGDYSFRDSAMTERIAARLGESDRRARFDPAVPGPFGLVVRELVLPGWLVRAADPDPDLAPTEIATGRGPDGPRIRFQFDTLPFVYDRLGLRREQIPQGTEEDIADG